MQANYNEFADKVETIACTIMLETDPSAALAVSMYAGTLFVECNADTAAKIRSALKLQLGCSVRTVKIAHEFAFDFTV